MLTTRSDRLTLAALAAAAALLVPAALVATPGPTVPAPPVAPAPPLAPAAPAAPLPPQAVRGGLVSSEIDLSADEAKLQLQLAGGRTVEFALRDGHAYVDGAEVGPAPRGGRLDRAWRDLLNRAIDTPVSGLGALLASWSAPDGGAGTRLHTALLAAISGEAPMAAAPDAPAPPSLGPSSDSLTKLQERIEELQRTVERLQGRRAAAVARADEDSPWLRPFHHIWRGISDILAALVVLAVLFGIGVVTIYFGGRPHLEAVADTARQLTLRSWLVGLAASFLIVPVFVLGILALTISIVGIPALLVWIPLFPVAVVLAALLGYLAIAHAAGEGLAERRLYAGEWFRRGNSYYFLITGLALLMALFIAGSVVEMAGPWLGFIHGTLTFLGGVVTWFAATTGLGAVLLSRAGTRPPAGVHTGRTLDESVFEEETHV
ncbi:MAG: hypothetical protein IRZ00_07015 [Gemmatimonadetes bacterium]|nr:hypothetical protein [Gemmatimonadota bacterium]